MPAQYQSITPCSLSASRCPVTAQLNAGKKLNSVVISVTPMLARHFLREHKRYNRSTSAAVVARYARQLRKGTFVLTHQGLAFNDRGQMMDGYHRCSAIELTEIPAECLISTGWPDSNYMVIDTGRKRIASQFLGKYGNEKNAAINYLRYVSGERQTLWGSSQQDIAVTQRIYEEWPELDEYAEAAYTCHRCSQVSAGAHLAVLCQASRVQGSSELIDSWITWLSSPPAELRKACAPWLLSHYFMSKSSKKKRSTASVSTRAEDYCKTVSAWNAHALDEPVQRLRWSSNEKIPAVAGFVYRS